jgi:hypothetical protein
LPRTPRARGEGRSARTWPLPKAPIRASRAITHLRFFTGCENRPVFKNLVVKDPSRRGDVLRCLIDQAIRNGGPDGRSPRKAARWSGQSLQDSNSVQVKPVCCLSPGHRPGFSQRCCQSPAVRSELETH